MLNIVVFLVSVHAVTVLTSSNDNIRIRRFIHGCPFAFPCPPPPCFDAVFGPGNCCGSCPDPEPEVSKPEISTVANTDLSIVSDLENGGRNSEKQRAVFKRYLTKSTPPTTTECPYPCTHQGHHYCYPLPCHIACVNAVRPPGGCCYVCPDGPNCGYNGNMIPEGQNVTLQSGESVFCHSGGLYGGSYSVVKPVVG